MMNYELWIRMHIESHVDMEIVENSMEYVNIGLPHYAHTDSIDNLLAINSKCGWSN